MTRVDDQSVGAAIVGARLRQLRLLRGLSQRELAVGVDRCSYAYVSRVEGGARVPSWRVLHELARKLAAPALYLAYGAGRHACPTCGTVVDVPEPDELHRFLCGCMGRQAGDVVELVYRCEQHDGEDGRP